MKNRSVSRLFYAEMVDVDGFLVRLLFFHRAAQWHYEVRNISSQVLKINITTTFVVKLPKNEMQSLILMEKSTEFELPLLEAIQIRRSKRAYADRPIETEKIQSLFEAARWAPSSSNEQPWVYIYATKDQPELWGKLFDTLMDGNKIWAERAPLLIMSLIRKNFVRNEKPNGSAKYDLGAANAFLSLQATHLGLNVHQMGGFDRQLATNNLNVPDSHEVAVMMAIGYLGDPEILPENLKQREIAPRERYVQQEFAMNKTF